MADLVGQKLGNYQLTRFLGRGGFADVYLGEHQRLKTLAAIKVLHTRLSEKDVDGFLQEAQFIANLEHPHIIRVLDFDVMEDGAPFLVMSYAPNGTLRDLHPKGAPLPLPTIIGYVKQVADALQYAHDEKLIHRDVKPENMLLGKRREVLLGDFGIALVAQSSRYQSTQEMAGTMAYMAPEQIQGKPRPASDQYALGIVVYEWVSGERPFHGSFTEIVAQHLTTPPAPLRERIPTISPSIQEVVMIALSKDPKERFASVQAFANALERASQSDAPTYVAPLAPTLLSNPIPPPPLPPSFDRPSPSVTPVSLPPTQYVVPSKPVVNVVSTFRKHLGRVNTIMWSPDGRHIASGSNDFMVYVWDASDSGNTYTYWEHGSTVNGVAWSPDSRRIASASDDQTVQVWDATTGKSLLVYRGHAGWLRGMPVNGVAWSPDGRRIASASDDETVQVWDATTGKKLLTYRSNAGRVTWMRAVTWSPDSTRVASGSVDKTAQIWDAATGKNFLIYRGHANGVNTVAWSPDGERIVSISDDRTVQIWNAATGTNLLTYRDHSTSVLAVTWSPDSKYIASGEANGKIKVWNRANGQTVYTYSGHSGSVRAVAWSPDGRYIASGGDDKTVQVWVAPN